MAPEAMLTAKHKLFDAIRAHAAFAARFECVGQNFDRPIGYDEHGRERMDPRWYAVMSAKTHFNEGLSNAIADALAEYTAVVVYHGERAPTAEEGKE